MVWQFAYVHGEEGGPFYKFEEGDYEVKNCFLLEISHKSTISLFGFSLAWDKVNAFCRKDMYRTLPSEIGLQDESSSYSTSL